MPAGPGRGRSSDDQQLHASAAQQSDEPDSRLRRPQVIGRGPTLPSITRDDNNVRRYAPGVIKSFRDGDVERLFDRQPVRKFGKEVQRLSLRKLRFLDAATSLEDLRIPPGNRVERLHGDRSGQHSIRISDQWRICFRWREGDAYDVEIVDYR